MIKSAPYIAAILAGFINGSIWTMLGINHWTIHLYGGLAGMVAGCTTYWLLSKAIKIQ